MRDEGSRRLTEENSGFSPTLRELLAPVFRRRRLVAIAFLVILLAAMGVALLLPTQYEAQMKILVKRERVDPIVTPDEPALAPPHTDVTEEELNSEVELLKGRDLLEKVVLACNPQASSDAPMGARLLRLLVGRGTTAETRNGNAASLEVRALEKELRVEPIKKTNLIQVRYESPDPHLAARVLTTLADLYLEKHLAVHRPPGEFNFFQQEMERTREQLIAAEKRQQGFSRSGGVVSAQLEKEIAVRKLADFEAALLETQASVAETQKRIQDLEAQLAGTPVRRTTQVRTSDNSALLQELKATLLNLELKRTDLLEKFEPTYRLVREVEQQITQTRAAIESAERDPLREKTTDRDPTHDWVQGELAKAEADRAALEARATAMARAVAGYQQKAELLDQKGTVQEDLMRDVRAAEGNYLLYLRKQEEARISDALDRQRILNVAIAEAATVPSLPSRSPWLPTLLLGGLLGSVVSIGLAFAADYLDPSLRTPDELELLLNLPVLAAIPKESR